MARLPELLTADMNDAQRAVADEIVSGPHKRIVGPYHAWLHSPELARRARSLSEFIRFNSSLSRQVSELAILVTGRHWRADFEFWAHARLGREAGLEEAVITALAEGRRPELQDGTLAAVYDLASELLARRRISAPTYDRAVELLGLQSVVELVATIGYYSLVSVSLNAFEIPLPPGERSPFPDGSA